MKHLILGAGPAGVIAAETLRKHAPADRITVVGDEPEAPYSRMAIPYLLMGNIESGGTHLRKGADHYKALAVDVKHGRATKIDSSARRVTLVDGSVLDYDRLLIATGAKPARPPIEGMDSPCVLSCWTLADARRIMDLATPGARVVQMGAGFIGCIIMEALANRGVKLSVVEMGDRMVPRMMGPAAGGMIKDWCKSKGVDVHTSAKVERIEDFGRFLRVQLADKTSLDAELVISATGVRPAIGFLEGSGITTKTGIVTDERLATNVDGVYAAGDCAEALDLPSGQHVISAIQPNAAEQARVAALNMLGHKAVLKRVPQINVLDTLGLISASFGKWDGVPGGQQASVVDPVHRRVLDLQFDGDRLVGANSVGWTEHVGVMRGLVDSGVPLGPWRDQLLQDPSRLMEAYLATVQNASNWPLAASRK